MGSKRQNETEKRLAQVRVLKERYFSDELTVEERIQAKDARIALLENQVVELKRRLESLERADRKRTVQRNDTDPPEISQPERPKPRVDGRRPIFESEQHGFDFYRD